MDIEWSENDLAFRDEVRAFLDERLTPELRRADRLMTSVYADHDASMRWQAILYERGWAAPAWPVEHGGCDWSLTQRYIFSRESILAGAPSLSPMGIQQVAHVITEFGTPEQKAYFLPRILTGEAFFCQGYSEPDGLGPRLAEHERRRGRRRPHLHRQQDLDHPCPRGQLDVLPGPDHPRRKKQQGITFLLIDMTVPGIEVRPLVMTSGEQIQNQEFFDHVRVPKSNVIGEIDDGWTVAKYLLEFERGGVAAAPRLQVMADEVAQAASAQPGPDGRPLIDCPSFAAKLADARIRIDVLEMLEFRVLSAAAAAGETPARRRRC